MGGKKKKGRLKHTVEEVHLVLVALEAASAGSKSGRFEALVGNIAVLKTPIPLLGLIGEESGLKRSALSLGTARLLRLIFSGRDFKEASPKSDSEVGCAEGMSY